MPGVPCVSPVAPKEWPFSRRIHNSSKDFNWSVRCREPLHRCPAVVQCAREQGVPETYQKADDVELVEACIAGSDAAWAVLVDRYARLVYSIPARHGLDPDLHEDIFQAVWTIAVRHLDSLRDAQSLPAWLIRTTQRETWRQARAAGKPGTADTGDEISWTDPEEAQLMEDRQRMREALGMLDDRCRELLLACFREDRPDYDRLAEQLRMPRGSIGPTRGRCLNKLRILCAERHPDAIS